MNDPKFLFHRVLDPPNWKTIQYDLYLLVSLDTLKARSHHRGKYEPTLYGNFLRSLPLYLEALILVIKFGQCANVNSKTRKWISSMNAQLLR